MDKDNNYIGRLNSSIKSLFYDALKISFLSPSKALFILQTMARQRKAAAKRIKWEKKGVHVPPFVIASITNKCNLSCKGCYAKAHFNINEQEIDAQKFKGILNESRDLGISIFLLAGGEPLLRQDIIDLIGKYPDIIFLVFTNGFLINEAMVNKIKKMKNVVPVLSLEGYGDLTDERRGRGVFDNIINKAKMLNDAGIFMGSSITMTKDNFDVVTEDLFIKDMVQLGCKLFIYVEYVPVEGNTEDRVITMSQREKVIHLMDAFRKKYPALFIAFPGDEESFGGCLAAGRGFIHINPSGKVEPCPFSPYKEALESNLLKEIRNAHNELKETKGGCALWTKRDWVKSLLTPVSKINK